MSFHNNNHFDSIYSIHQNLNNIVLINDIDNIKINSSFDNIDIKVSGTYFKNDYIDCRYPYSKDFYNEIYQFLLSINDNKKEILELQIQNPNWHYNQILSKFNLKYPKRLEGEDNKNLEKRKNFRKCIENYILNENNRLCIINPLKTEKI